MKNVMLQNFWDTLYISADPSRNITILRTEPTTSRARPHLPACARERTSRIPDTGVAGSAARPGNGVPLSSRRHTAESSSQQAQPPNSSDQTNRIHEHGQMWRKVKGFIHKEV